MRENMIKITESRLKEPAFLFLNIIFYYLFLNIIFSPRHKTVLNGFYGAAYSPLNGSPPFTADIDGRY